MDRLLGAGAAAIGAPAVPAGSTLTALRPRQVLYRPRRRVAVTYDAVLESPRGERREERMVAMARRSRPPEGVVPSKAGDLPVGVWRAAEVAGVHRRLEGVVPVARCTPLDAPGVLRLETLHGSTLGHSLRRGSPPAPPADALLEVLERLGAVGLSGPRDRPSDERLDEYVVLLEALVPEEAERL